MYLHHAVLYHIILYLYGKPQIIISYHIILGEDIYVSHHIVLRYIEYRSSLLKAFTYGIVSHRIVSHRTVSDRALAYLSDKTGDPG